MSTAKSLEQRVAVLEAEVARLKSGSEKAVSTDEPWWEKIYGIFADDPAFEEAMRLGREWRESQRPDYVTAKPKAQKR